MLKGIHPLLHADLLHTLAAMGHGDELVIADANFPAASMARRLIHTAGASAPEVLDAVLTLLPLDTFVVPAALTMRVIDERAALPVTDLLAAELLSLPLYPDLTEAEVDRIVDCLATSLT